MAQTVNTPNAPEAIGPYSQAVRSGNVLYCSGQIPLDPKTGQVIEGDVVAQTHQVMKNLAEVLRTQDTHFDRVIKCTIFIKNMNDFPKINEAYGSYFEGHLPARACVEVARLPKDVEVEIDCIAEC